MFAAETFCWVWMHIAYERVHRALSTAGAFQLVLGVYSKSIYAPRAQKGGGP